MVRKGGATSLSGRAKPESRVRLIGGKWRRSWLPVLDAPGLRPTPDRVRETAFNWIVHQLGGSLSGVSAFDPFCGSGALGLEAASRGAAPVVLADANASVIASLRSTLSRLKAEEVTLVVADALQLIGRFAAAGERFAVVFLDPPFGEAWISRVLPCLHAISAEGGLVYVESEGELSEDEAAKSGFERLRADKAGQVFYHLLRRNIDAPVA